MPAPLATATMSVVPAVASIVVSAFLLRESDDVVLLAAIAGVVARSHGNSHGDRHVRTDAEADVVLGDAGF